MVYAVASKFADKPYCIICGTVASCGSARESDPYRVAAIRFRSRGNDIYCRKRNFFAKLLTNPIFVV